jgi:hypothetical protein
MKSLNKKQVVEKKRSPHLLDVPYARLGETMAMREPVWRFPFRGRLLA